MILLNQQCIILQWKKKKAICRSFITHVSHSVFPIYVFYQITHNYLYYNTNKIIFYFSYTMDLLNKTIIFLLLLFFNEYKIFLE